MKKKLVATVLSAFLVLGGAAAVFAATTDQEKLDEIKGLYQQIQELQKQVVEKKVEAGTLSKEQADSIKSRIEQQENYPAGCGVGSGASAGAGCGISQGCGSGQGFGPNAGTNSSFTQN